VIRNNVRRRLYACLEARKQAASIARFQANRAHQHDVEEYTTLRRSTESRLVLKLVASLFGNRCGSDSSFCYNKQARMYLPPPTRSIFYSSIGTPFAI